MKPIAKKPRVRVAPRLLLRVLVNRENPGGSFCFDGYLALCENLLNAWLGRPYIKNRVGVSVFDKPVPNSLQIRCTISCPPAYFKVGGWKMYVFTKAREELLNVVPPRGVCYVRFFDPGTGRVLKSEYPGYRLRASQVEGLVDND